MQNTIDQLDFSRTQRLALLSLVVLGSAIRALGLHRAIYLDEAWVIDSAQRPMLRDMLFYPDWAQTTPPGILLLLRGMTSFVGITPEHYRYLPFIASVLTLILGARLTLRCLSPGFALLATLMLAASPEVQWYATEIKQYVFDLLAATAMLWWGTDFIRAPARGSWYRWVASYCIGASLSLPVWLFLPAMIAVVALISASVARPLPLRAGVAGITVAVVTTAALYFGILRPNADLPSLRTFWNDGFLQTAGYSLAYFFRMALTEIFGFLPVASAAPLRTALVVALCGIGLGHRCYQQRAQPTRASAYLLLLLGPIVTLFAANAVEKYPLSDFRVVSFLVTTCIVMVVLGLEGMVIFGGRALRRNLSPQHIFICGIALTLASAIAYSNKKIHTSCALYPWQDHHDMRSVMHFLHAVDDLRRPLYVDATLRQMYAVYAPEFPLQTRKIDGDVGWPCCIPGHAWQLPQYKPDEVAHEVAELVQTVGSREFFLVLFAGSEKQNAPTLFQAELANRNCATPLRINTAGVALLKAVCHEPQVSR